MKPHGCQVAPLLLSLATSTLLSSHPQLSSSYKTTHPLGRLVILFCFFPCSRPPSHSPRPRTWWSCWWTAGALARRPWWRRASSSPTTTLPPSRALPSPPSSRGNIRTRVNHSPLTHSIAPSFSAVNSGNSYKSHKMTSYSNQGVWLPCGEPQRCRRSCHNYN